VAMMQFHLGKLGSLREVSDGKRSTIGHLNHQGVVKPATKSNLSYQTGQL
jgi:hypothetical protein